MQMHPVENNPAGLLKIILSRKNGRGKKVPVSRILKDNRVSKYVFTNLNAKKC